MLRHVLSALSFCVISVNLLFWSVPLLVLAVLKILLPGGRTQLRAWMEAIYRWAVAIDDFWFANVLGMHWDRPQLNLDKGESYVVLSNHRTWMDIFVIQSAISRTGPIVKFLTKRELAWIPVIGLIAWAFDFPLLRRSAKNEGQSERRGEDRLRVKDACAVLLQAPGAMLSFVVGTRFTPAKHRVFDSPYEHLLPARPGGFVSMVEALPDAAVIDITLRYPEQTSFWRMLGGGFPAPHD